MKGVSALCVAIILSLPGVVAVSGIAHTQVSEAGHALSAMHTDCPFMVHEETWCPMSALDHLMSLRSIFEAVMLGATVMVMVIGAATSLYRSITVVVSSSSLISTFWHWRKSVTRQFSLRLYQDLFARGILNPKLF